MSVLEQDYTISQDWTGAKYLGIDLNWDYAGRQVHRSMLDYVPAALKRFNHVAPNKPQDQPYPHTKPKHGQKVQCAKGADDSPPLSKADKKFVQEVVGVFLYYARAVDLTMLAALGSLASEQASPTENIMNKVLLFLDYAATHPDAIVTFHASDMILAVHSNDAAI